MMVRIKKLLFLFNFCTDDKNILQILNISKFILRFIKYKILINSQYKKKFYSTFFTSILSSRIISFFLYYNKSIICNFLNAFCCNLNAKCHKLHLK